MSLHVVFDLTLALFVILLLAVAHAHRKEIDRLEELAERCADDIRRLDDEIRQTDCQVEAVQDATNQRIDRLAAALGYIEEQQKRVPARFVLAGSSSAPMPPRSELETQRSDEAKP